MGGEFVLAQCCCGTATRCALPLAPPFPLHLPQRFTAGIALRNSSACSCHPCGLCGEAASPQGHAQGRTWTLPACPEDQRKRDGGDRIRPRASPSFVHPVPLMSHKSAQIYAANLLFWVASHVATRGPSHTPTTTRPG